MSGHHRNYVDVPATLVSPQLAANTQVLSKVSASKWKRQSPILSLAHRVHFRDDDARLPLGSAPTHSLGLPAQWKQARVAPPAEGCEGNLQKKLRCEKGMILARSMGVSAFVKLPISISRLEGKHKAPRISEEKSQKDSLKEKRDTHGIRLLQGYLRGLGRGLHRLVDHKMWMNRLGWPPF